MQSFWFASRRSLMLAGLGLALAAPIGVWDSGALAQDRDKPAKQLFGGESVPSRQAPRAIGGYARGCLAGGETLAINGPGWQAMRLSRNRRHGHPELIAYIKRLANSALAQDWPGILVGDLAQARGGPMLTGHSSHQIGLDADIWLLPAPSKPYSDRDREKVSAINYVRKNRREVTSNFSPGHHALLRKAAEDPAVARIFVNAAIKKALCVRAEQWGEDMDWLRKIRPWWGHDHHFHVRLHCPDNSADCRSQQPPPPGSGCGKEVDSWLTPQALNPPKPKTPTKKKKRRIITLADLPNACEAVLQARDAR